MPLKIIAYINLSQEEPILIAIQSHILYLIFKNKTFKIFVLLDFSLIICLYTRKNNTEFGKRSKIKNIKF